MLRVAKRCHLEFDDRESKRLDRRDGADVAIADNGDRLAVELGKDVIERVLERRAIAVVVLRRHDEHAACGVATPSEDGHGLGGVVVSRARRRDRAVAERERMVREVDHPARQIVTPAETTDEPGQRLVREARRADRSDDDLDERGHRPAGGTTTRAGSRHTL